MPELTFDEFGNPVWTNQPGDSSGTDPDPLGDALAAVSLIGVEGGIPIPPNPAEFQPGAELPHAPPAPTAENAIMTPGEDMVLPGAPQLTPVGSGVMHSENQNLSPYGVPLGPPEPDAISGAAPVSAPVSSLPAAEANAQRSLAATDPTTVGVPKKGKGAPVDDLARANAAVDLSILDAAEAGAKSAMAQNEAARQLAERRAGAQENYARLNADSDAKFQAARQQAQQEADQETARWMTDLENQAKKEPNPQRWFAQKSTAGKALYLLSLAFGTKAAASAPGVQNVAIAMWKDEMDRDMSEQRAKLAREMETLKMKGQAIDRRTAQRMQNLRDDHAIRAGQLLSLEKAALERANAPGSADDQAAWMQAHQWLAQQRMQVAGTRASQAFQAKESKLARAHAWGMQANRQTFEAEQKNLDRIHDVLMKDVEASARTQEALAKAQGERMVFDPASSGMAITRKVDGKMVAEPLAVTKEQHEEMKNISQASQRATADLIIIRNAIKDGSVLERIAGSDPELNAALARSGYQSAKVNDPRGIVTNADFANGMKTSIGFDMSTATGRALAEAKLKVGGKDLVKSIDKEIRRIETSTQQELNATVDAKALRGGTIQWRAVNRNARDLPDESLGEATSRVTGDSNESGPITSVGQLEKAEKEGKALPEYQRLPEKALGFSAGTSTESVLEDAKNNFAQVSPATLDKLYSKYHETLEPVDKRADVEMYRAYDKAKDKAEAAEEKAKTRLVQRTFAKEPVTRDMVVEELKKAGLARTAKEDPKYVDEVMEAVRAVTVQGSKKN